MLEGFQCPPIEIQHCMYIYICSADYEIQKNPVNDPELVCISNLLLPPP